MFCDEFFFPLSQVIIGPGALCKMIFSSWEPFPVIAGIGMIAAIVH